MLSRIRPLKNMCSLCLIILLLSCTTDKLLEKEDFDISSETSKVSPLPEPEPYKAEEPKEIEPSPLEGKAITLTAKRADFTDIVSAIAEISGLDLVIDSMLTCEVQAGEDDTSQGQQQGLDKNVISIAPVTIAFNDTPLSDALDNLCTSIQVFYTVRNNSLIIRGTEARTFHLNFLSSQKETHISVGGDVLSGGGDDSGQRPLSGEFSIQDTTSATSSDIYAQIEEVVKSSLSPHGSFSLNRAIGILEIKDRRDSIERIESYIKNIKTYYNSQVLITAKVVEVSLSDSSRYGIDWTSIHGNIGDYSFNPIEQNLLIPTGNLLPALEIEVNSPEHGIDAALNALEEFGDIKVLSNPRIRVTNGQPALISVGTSSSYIQEITLTITTLDGGGTITEPEVTIGSIFDGIMLGVIPYIDLESGYVNISITPIKSRVIKLEERNISGNTYTLPTVDLEETSTQIRVKNGNIVALGGLISKNLVNTTKSIPILGDIPYLGYLFSQNVKSVETNELVILLEPVIIQK